MALSISQIVAVSYADVVADQRKPANQWAESALMRTMESMGMIDRRNLGSTIEAPIDYRRNPGTDFLATDLTPVSLVKTEVMSAASFSIAELSVPTVWSKGDDAKNPTENQKVAFVKSLLENALNSHDDAIEEALFATSTDGFLGLQTIVPTSGQGSVGGIDAALETFWRNPADTFLADGSDMEAVLTELWNSATKGSGSKMIPKVLVSGAATNALFKSTQQAFQRFTDSTKFNVGSESIAFQSAPYIYSQYGGTKIYGLGAAFKLVVSKQYFRDKGETRETDEANGFIFKIYSALQSITNNKSRLFVASQA